MAGCWRRPPDNERPGSRCFGQDPQLPRGNPYTEEDQINLA